MTDIKAPTQRETTITVAPDVRGEHRELVIPTGLGKQTIDNLKTAARFLLGEGAYYFDRLSEKKRTNKAREIVALGAAEFLVAGMGNGDPRAERALALEAERIIGEQDNVDRIATNAAEHLRVSPPLPGTDAASEIGSDWLRQFRELAKNVSTEAMSAAFSRILAGEAIAPGSFSPRAVRILAELIDDVAATFVRACGCAMMQPHGEPRICELDTSATSNGLEPFGLSYSDLIDLQEHGLIDTELPTNMTIAVEALETFTMSIAGQKFFLRDTSGRPKDAQIGFSGVGFSRAGAQLATIVQSTPNERYISLMKSWLEEHQFSIELPTDAVT